MPGPPSGRGSRSLGCPSEQSADAHRMERTARHGFASAPCSYLACRSIVSGAPTSEVCCCSLQLQVVLQSLVPGVSRALAGFGPWYVTLRSLVGTPVAGHLQNLQKPVITRVQDDQPKQMTHLSASIHGPLAVNICPMGGWISLLSICS